MIPSSDVGSWSFLSLVLTVLTVSTNSNSHWVEQEVFLQCFWALPSFKERFLAGLRLCRFLLSYFCFLAQSESWHFFFYFVLQKAVCFFPSTVKHYRSCLCLDEAISQSFAFLIGWLSISYEFVAGLFSCVDLSMYEIKLYLYCSPLRFHC